MTEPRYVEVRKAVGVWRVYEIDVRLEVAPYQYSTLTMNREEAAALRDKLTRYLGDKK